MFNQAIQDEPESYGNFAFIPITALNQHGDDQEMLQGGYVVGYGKLRACMFEARHDGVFISDRIKDQTASQEEIELQANLDQLEASILNTQNFTLEGVEWPYPNIMNETRMNLLNQILTDLYTGNQFGGEE